MKKKRIWDERRAQQYKEWRERNRDKTRKNTKNWKDANRDKVNAAQARRRAQKRALGIKEPYDPQKVRARYLLRTYNISLEEYDRLYEKQKGLCALCARPQYKRKYLNVDHCHESGKIRGLLCVMCNRALGALGDSIESIKKVLEYLQNAQ